VEVTTNEHTEALHSHLIGLQLLDRAVTLISHQKYTRKCHFQIKKVKKIVW